MKARVLCSVFVLLAAAVPAAAQQAVTLQFQGGLVTLRAQNAPVRTILAEWARLGGTTIVNGDRVVGPPVTLELTGVPERQALDIVLRNVAGYMLAPRRAGASGSSAFDRVMILPTSAAPRNPPPAPAAAAAGPRPVLPRPSVIPRPPDAPVGLTQPDETAEANGPADQPVPLYDPRRRPGAFVRRPVPPGADPGADQEEQDDETPATPGQEAVAPTPGNPFGIPFGTSTTPGVVAQPQTQQPLSNRVQ